MPNRKGLLNLLPPEDCQTMIEVREGVDATDRELVMLLKRRFGYMDAAARIKTEYDLGVRFEQGAFETARWLSGPADEIKRFEDAHRSMTAEDHDGVRVFMARNAWDLDRMTRDWPALKFNATREQTAEETV